MIEKDYGKLVPTAEEMIEAHFKACVLSLPTSHLKDITLPYLFVFSLFKNAVSNSEYCQVSKVCVTNETGFESDDPIYLTFIKLVTTVHKSLSSSAGYSRLLTTLHNFTTPVHSVPSSDLALL
jgi:hypothetical protein